ncbi:MAG: 23S rRNA (pseudouridine(1915)-N(3))-methyltransferase RlmH [Gemmatimonadota bacterium]|nr:23S rRNA (pseudouridine(1915)-N(3))-methyltransferase RlmH [Gemmatimonadota bacterium]
MKITLVAVGRVRGSLAEALREYEERARRYWKLETVEVDSGAGSGRREPESVLHAEEARILARTPPGAKLVALTRGGQPLGSRAFTSYLEDHALNSKDLVFVVGGAFGLSATVLANARQLTLSPMTLPHDIARLVLAEQLYRAGTILRGEPYHKGT